MLVDDSTVRVSCFVCDSNKSQSLGVYKGYNIDRCSECSFIFVNPRPTEEALRKLYSNPDTNAFAAQSFSPTHLEQHTFAKLIKCLKAHKASGRILEIGCGRGDFLSAAQAAGYVAEGCELTQSVEEEKTPYTIHRKELSEIKFPAGTFDVVIVRNTFEHYFDPRKELKEIRRILAPNGILYLKVPNISFELGWKSFVTYQEWNLFCPPWHLNHFSPKTMKAFLKQSGFRFRTWEIEIPSTEENPKKNFLRQSAYHLFNTLHLLTGRRYGSSPTLTCVSEVGI